MICPKCNQANSDDAKVCGHCGASIVSSAGGAPLSATAGAGAAAGAAAGATAPGATAWGEGAAPVAGIVERIKNILLSPKSEWPVIERESTSIVQLYVGYVLPLAAFAAIMSFIRMSVIGVSMPFGGTFRVSMYDGLTMMIVRLVAALIGVFLIGLLINALAPTFSGQRDNQQALKSAAYAFTPAWLASVFLLLGGLGALLQLLAAFYGIYLLYLGLPVLMKCARDKAVGYTAAVVICTILLAVVFGVLNRATGGFGGYASFSAAPMQSIHQRRAAELRGVVGGALGMDQRTEQDVNAAVDRLAEIGRQLQQQAAQQQAQQQQGRQAPAAAEPAATPPTAMPATGTEAANPQSN